MASVFEVDAEEFNKLLASELKKVPEFEEPDWVGFVKSSVARSRPIDEEDFWFKRAASILRQIYIRGVVGANRLRTRYGGKKNRGGKRSVMRKGSGKIIRLILQQAEKAGFLEKTEGKRKGRRLTKQGVKFLEDIAEKIKKKD